MGKDVEVEYTGREIYHIADNDLGYDGKIESRPDGAYALYETESNWKDHSHTEYDKSGNVTYHRSEGENHSWNHHQRDFIASQLVQLSFEDLQYIEATSQNIYIKSSARALLNSTNFSLETEKKYTLKY